MRGGGDGGAEQRPSAGQGGAGRRGQAARAGREHGQAGLVRPADEGDAAVDEHRRCSVDQAAGQAGRR
ncbi:hypothetical protein [Blastococcus sp. SYSU DS0541]